MERTELAAVLPVNFRWSDIGSWNAVWDAQEQDAAGNVIEGPAEVIDTSNSLIRSEDTVLTTVIGLDDVIVIATADAVLVVAQAGGRTGQGPRRAAQGAATAPRRWSTGGSTGRGASTRAPISASRYQVKRICVNPGARLSLQKHFHRSEHWVVVRGVAEVTIGEEVRLYHENESVYVPIGAVHRLANPGKIPLELIEVQVGSYLGEDDILRLEDVYRRHAEA